MNKFFEILEKSWSRESSAGKTTGNGLDGQNSIPDSARFLSSTASGAHPGSYSKGTGSTFSGGKTEGAWSSPLTAI
jgi:hypothetical protein